MKSSYYSILAVKTLGLFLVWLLLSASVDLVHIGLGLLVAGSLHAQQPTEKQLANGLKRFPAADTNKDGKLSLKEALAFRNQIQGQQRRQRGAPHNFTVDPGWAKAPEFPISSKPTTFF